MILVHLCVAYCCMSAGTSTPKTMNHHTSQTSYKSANDILDYMIYVSFPQR